MPVRHEPAALQNRTHAIEREALTGEHPSDHRAWRLIDLGERITNSLQVGWRSGRRKRRGSHGATERIWGLQFAPKVSKQLGRVLRLLKIENLHCLQRIVHCLAI